MWLVKTWWRALATGIFVIFYLVLAYFAEHMLHVFSNAWEGEPPPSLGEPMPHAALFVIMASQIACLAIVVFRRPSTARVIATIMAILLTMLQFFRGAVTCVVFLALFYYLEYDISRRHADEENGDEPLPERHEVG